MIEVEVEIDRMFCWVEDDEFRVRRLDEMTGRPVFFVSVDRDEMFVQVDLNLIAALCIGVTTTTGRYVSGREGSMRCGGGGVVVLAWSLSLCVNVVRDDFGRIKPCPT